MKEDMTKKQFILSIGLMLAATTAFTTVQTKSTQDKPWRVFLLSDVQDLNATTHYKNEVYENADGGNEADDDDGTSENQTWINYNHVWVAGIGGEGSEFNNWQDDNWDYLGNHSGSAGGMTGNMAWDWTGWGAEVGTYNDGTTTTGFTNTLWIWDKIGNEHCNVNDPVNKTWDNDDSLWDDDNDRGSQHDTYTRTADTTWHVQTGGKAIPTRKNLWQFSGSAWEILDKRAVPPFSGAQTRGIDPTQIQILGKNLDTNGVLYKLLADGQELDVTPQVPGKDFYTFGVGGQKYLSHFTAFVDMPGPPPSHVTHVGLDYGHAWWMLSSDVPIDVLNRFTSTNRSHFCNEEVGYADHGSWRGPGILRDPETNTKKDEVRTYDIGFPDLLDGLAYTQGIHDNPGTYNVFNNNCVQHVIAAGAAAGLSLPHDTKPEDFGWDLINSP